MLKRPNILLVVTDQQRPDMIGCLGQVPVNTPNLDRLCREGTVYDRAYVACPLCTPSRASLISGQYPSRHGAWSIGVDTPEDILSVADILRNKADYATALIGKSHLQSGLREGSKEAPPFSQNWDYYRGWEGPWYGFETARINVGHTCEHHAYSMHYGLWLHDKGVPLDDPYFTPGQDHSRAYASDGPWALPEEHHVGRWIVEETVNWLDNHRAQSADRPFFLSINFPDPHPPFKVPESWAGLHADVPLPPPVRRADELTGKPTLYRATVEQTLADLKLSPLGVRPPGQNSPGLLPAERTAEEELKWRTHMDMCSLLDHHLGEILAYLDEHQLAEDTLIVFTSDHGDYLGDHHLWSKGGSHYDAAVRVPFIIKWPGKTKANQRSQALQSLADIAPTFLRCAGIDIPAEMQGIDQSQSWQDPNHSCREGVWIDHRVEDGLTVNTWITDRYRLSLHSLTHTGQDECELYDLSEDPHEFNNLAHTPAGSTLQSQLTSQMIRHWSTIQGPWSSRPTFA